MARARKRAGEGDRRPAWSGSVAAEALRAMPEAVVVCGTDGRIVAANEAMHTLLGYADKKLVGRKLEKLVPEDLRALHRTHRQDFIHDRGPGAHRAGRLFKARHRDGHLVPVDIAIANLRTEDGPLSLALLRPLDDPATAGKQLAELAELYAVMAWALSAVLHADNDTDLYAAVCDVAIDHTEVTLAWVAELEAGTVSPVAVSGPLAEAVGELTVELGDDHPVSLAVTLGSTVVVPDLALEPAFRPRRTDRPDADPRPAVTGSLCVLPLRQSGRMVGVLALVNPLVSGFTDEGITVLEWLAAEVSSALEDLAAVAVTVSAGPRGGVAVAEPITTAPPPPPPPSSPLPPPPPPPLLAPPVEAVPARLEAQVWRDEVVVGLALLAVATADPGDVAEAVVEAAGQTLGLDSAVLVESTPGQRATVRAAWFGTDAALDEAHAEPHADLHTVVLAQGGPLVIEDIHSDPRLGGIVAAGTPSTSGLAVEVGGLPGFHGSLSALSVEARSFDDDEVAFLARLADLVASSFERARADEEPEHQRLLDPLTDLPNRALFRDRLDQTVARISGDDQLVVVLIVHVDGYDGLLDGYGRESADSVLVALAERLVGAVDPEAVVARMRTDEFAVLDVVAGTIDDVSDLTDRIRVALAPAVTAGDVSLQITTSIGVSMLVASDANTERLLREADAAVDRATRAGTNRTELYDLDLLRQARRRIDQASALRRAIEEDELLVVWQAAYPLQPSEAAGAGDIWAEALVRWRNPERGLVSPGNFIALAEETGLIVPVGDAVLRMACRQLAVWRRQGGNSPTRISVNLSPRQLAQDDLATTVAEILADEGVNPGALSFEITESALTSGPDDAIRRLNQLRDLGVELAMDDFGTGQSSLGHLRRLPVSVLKIDQSFIRGLTTHRADWAIVHGLVEMGHGIGLTVVAEGIETVEQLDHLVALGCDRGQGFYWSSPVAAEALDRMLVDWTSPSAPPAPSSD